jgi:serine/threonine protein kinase
MSRSRYPLISRSDPEKDFELVKQIGSGTYGDVYKAKMISSEQLCALKIIKIEPGEDFNIIQQEIAILSECKHPNIVGYYGSYLRRDKLWIAMEFCGGGSLQDIYRVQGGLSELQIAFVSRETLVGLHYLHAQNKMHRDIKGANILLTDDGAVKLADFGIAAKMTNTLMRRATFIGTPYWMAPEVADVEKQGGYNHKCDVWAVGITAIELAEKKPPNFDLHPMKALVKMTKKKFTPPTLTQKEKWTGLFHDFLKVCLQKDPKKRPTTSELLKHPFVGQANLGPHLTKPLAKILTSSSRRKQVDDDYLEDDEEITYKSDDTLKKIQSMPKDNKGNVQSDIAGHNLHLNPQPPKTENKEPLPSWMQAEAGRGNIRKVAKKSSEPKTNDDDTPNYVRVGENLSDRAPPLPPRPESREKGGKGPSNLPHPRKSSDPAPPHPPKPPERPSEPHAYFSKIFNGCPLHLTCAQTWTHPHTGIEYVYLGAEEGLYSLQMTQSGDPIMEQVNPRSVHWLCIFNNALISIAGRSRHLCETNLILLHDKDSQQQRFGSQRNPTHKIQDSKGCIKCDIARNPYNDQKFLVASVPKGILLLRWYPPRHIFMMDKFVEVKLPDGVPVFQSFVNEAEEYPLVCLGVYEGEAGGVHFDTYNLNSQSQFYGENYGNKIVPCTLNQVEENAVMIGYDKYAKFVDTQGNPTTINKNISEVAFDHSASSIVKLNDCVLSFHRRGMQGKSLLTSKVTANVMDPSKVFKLLGSVMNIILETRLSSDMSGPSNLYVLVSEQT